MKNLIIRNGLAIDGENKAEQRDIFVCNGIISEKTPPSEATEIDAAGKLVMPGLVEAHAHFSTGPEGYFMLARAGVTTALDMLTVNDNFRKYLQDTPTGLTAAFLYGVYPGKTTADANPSEVEINALIKRALAMGCAGVKIIGGHFPLTAEATTRVIRQANEHGCWVAIHVGTTNYGSDIEGLKELKELAADLPVHVAHVNSYCRGKIMDDPVKEALEAIEIIKAMPNSISESYLDQINGCSAEITADNMPKSNVTRTCLRRGGFSENKQGLLDAIAAGWAQVNGKTHREIVLLPPDEGLKYYQDNNLETRVSFAVNSPAAQIALALARDENNHFVINALSTDGGNIPRNSTLSKGLALVDFGALSLEDFALKACVSPARMMGLEDRKGKLVPGMDADIIVVDQDKRKADIVISGGQIALRDGKFHPVANQLLTLKRNSLANSIPISPKWLQ